METKFNSEDVVGGNDSDDLYQIKVIPVQVNAKNYSNEHKVKNLENKSLIGAYFVNHSQSQYSTYSGSVSQLKNYGMH